MTAAFQEPYGLALRGTGTSPNFSPPYDKLPEGVNHITVGTRHPGRVDVHVTPTATRTDLVTLGVIPAGAGYRSLTMTFSVGTGEVQYLTVNGTEALATTARVSVTVVTIPLKK